MKLSILICTLENRKCQLAHILNRLNSQKTDEVEVLVESDDGTLETGTKRNILIDRSVGEYVCFVDDDDDVADNYIELIIASLTSNPDVVGISYLKGDELNTMSIFKKKDMNSGYVNHLCPTKREIMSAIKFKNISKGEDTDYQLRLNFSMLATTCVEIPQPLYIYNYDSTVEKEYNKKSSMGLGNIMIVGDDELKKFMDYSFDFYTFKRKKTAQGIWMKKINDIGIKTNVLINPYKKTLSPS